MENIMLLQSEENKISVIVVLYYSKFLLDNLITNLREKIKNIGEIILVNNSDENIDEYSGQDVTIINMDKNIGYGQGMNTGVKKAKYRALLLINPDIKFNKFDIEKYNLNEEEYIISGCDISNPTYMKFPTLFFELYRFSVLKISGGLRIINKKYFKDLSAVNKLLKVDWIYGSCIYTTIKTFSKLNGFSPDYFMFYEETDLCFRAEKENIPVYITREIEYESNKEKASSIETGEIKYTNEINSALKYHKSYDGIINTKTIFLCIKILYIFYIIFFKIINSIRKNKYLKTQKIISYYYKTI